MSMQVDTLLLILAIATEASLCVCVLRRRLWRVLPVFSSYLAWTLLSDVAIQVVYAGHSQLKFSALISETLLDSLLQLAVLAEVLWALLRPMRRSLPDFTPYALTVLILLGGVSIWFALGAAITGFLPPLVATYVRLQGTVAVLRILCLLGLFLASRFLALAWRDMELDVAAGMGFYSVVSLGVTAVQMHSGSLAGLPGPDLVVSASYLSVLGYWLVRFTGRRNRTAQGARF